MFKPIKKEFKVFFIKSINYKKYSIRNKYNFVSKIKIMPNGCWEWTGALYNNKSWSKRYGKFGLWINNKCVTMLAHRVSLELYNGCDINNLNQGSICCHTCDNPACCNPKHIFAGTQLDNIQDMINKGRQAIGENNGNSKLTTNNIIKIRKFYDSKKYSQRQLSKLFNVNYTTIRSIVRHEAWKNV